MSDQAGSQKLTPEQIQNWRNVLCGMIGPYALVMPAEQVQRIRDNLQRVANEEADGKSGVAPQEENHDH